MDKFNMPVGPEALGKRGFRKALSNGHPASHPCHGDQTDARCQPIVQANSKAKFPSNHRIAEGHNIAAEGEEGRLGHSYRAGGPSE